jgi:hypothetical protein
MFYLKTGKYKSIISAFFLSIMCVESFANMFSYVQLNSGYHTYYHYNNSKAVVHSTVRDDAHRSYYDFNKTVATMATPSAALHENTAAKNHRSLHNAVINKAVNHSYKPEIGGPGQPEMSSFKSIGADNNVDLFTGDFSYNIPLLDVGGYPISLHYNASPSVD